MTQYSDIDWNKLSEKIKLKRRVLGRVRNSGMEENIPDDTIKYEAHDVLVDMKYITLVTGLSDKFFYSQMKKGFFERPIKLGRASRWKLTYVEDWIEKRAATRSK